MESIIEETSKVLQPRYKIVDCGDSYRGDSLRRHQLLEAQVCNFIDFGTSGGVEGIGEVNWLINGAMHMEVPVPDISPAVMQLIASREKDKDKV